MEVQQKTYICCFWKTYNMKDILIRAGSGALYITILLGSLFISKLAFVSVIFILGVLACAEYSRLRKLNWWIGAPLLLAIFIAIHITDLWAQLPTLIVGLGLLMNLVLIYWLFKKPPFVSNLFGRLILIANVVFGFTAISLIPMEAANFRKEVMIGVLLMLWANDTFAYLVGRTIGKNKLMPSVSPKKTIEGFLGGAVGAIVVGLIISFYYPSFSLIMWLTLALIVVVFGTLGDLVQSRFKRIAGVKDSGVIMPGHGGMYDRLDSLIFAAPFVYLYLILVCYVS